jgi:ABC-2 type transport system permease protein
MNKAAIIANRELASYFYSPIAYVVMALFVWACGVLFWNDFEPGKVAGMRSLFQWMLYLMVPAVPLLAMGLIAQEWSTGTIEALMTLPISETDVILGKFMGAMTFLLILLSPTLLYVLLLMGYASPSLDLGPIVSGYLGIILVGAMFVAMGLLCSCLTRSQIIAAVSAAAVLFVLTIVPMMVGEKASLPAYARAVADFLVYRRYADFSRGIIDTSHIVFFLASTAAFLFLSVKALETRRWK